MPLTKKRFRENCLKKLRNSSKHNKLYKDSIVMNHLYKKLKFVKNKTILFYCPMPNEVDIRKLLKKLRKTNNILVPFMVGKSFKVVPYRLPLYASKFGIFEAKNSIKKNKKIDIAIVPVIGVDFNLQRIGFGKGMYDRFFAKLKKKPYTIFIQPELCFTKEKVCDDYDISCDVLLTPKVKTITRKWKNNVK